MIIIVMLVNGCIWWNNNGILFLLSDFDCMCF